MTKINDTFNHVKRTGSVMLKIFLIGFLTLLFLIPLEMISGVTTERAAYRDKAIDSVIQGWADEQVISGPVIVIPNIAPLKKRTEPAYFILTPRRLEVTGDIKTDMRYRGIYQVPVYKAVLKMRGDFNGSALPLSPEFASDKAFISFGIRDVRGIGNDLIVTWNNEKVSPKPGTGFSQWSKGFHIPLKQRIDTKKPTSFAVNMTLRGAQSFAVTPLGKETRVELSSNWQHPNFQGRFLPLKRDINDKGFSARWYCRQRCTACNA
jgi:inner membrane protein